MPLPSSVPNAPVHRRPLAAGVRSVALLPPLLRVARSVAAHPANGERAVRTDVTRPANRVAGSAPRCLR